MCIHIYIYIYIGNRKVYHGTCWQPGYRCDSHCLLGRRHFVALDVPRMHRRWVLLLNNPTWRHRMSMDIYIGPWRPWSLVKLRISIFHSHIYIYINTYIYVYNNVNIYIYIDILTCINIYVLTHTHIYI